MAKKAALGDLVDQLRPQPQPSAGELPYQLLRRAADYEVRHYPAWSGLAAAYERRDEAYLQLGEASQGTRRGSPCDTTHLSLTYTLHYIVRHESTGAIHCRGR